MLNIKNEENNEIIIKEDNKNKTNKKEPEESLTESVIKEEENKNTTKIDSEERLTESDIKKKIVENNQKEIYSYLNIKSQTIFKEKNFLIY